MISGFYVTWMAHDGSVDSDFIEADRMTADTSGLLRLYRGEDVVSAFAPGFWSSVVPSETDDVNGEATELHVDIDLSGVGAAVDEAARKAIASLERMQGRIRP